jgi:Protein of unknown function, DUF481
MRITTLLKPTISLLFLAAFIPTGAGGQETPDVWKAQLELGFNGASGNSSFGILRTGGSLTRTETESYEFEISALVRYGKSDARVIADDARGTVKFDWHPKSDFSPFVFVTVSRDRIRNLDSKVNSGVGAKRTLLKGERTKVSVSLAALLDYENFSLEAGSTEEGSRSAARWSGRFKLDHTFASGTKYSHVTFWQPEMNSVDDYIVEMTNTLSTTLLAQLSMAIQHEYLHDSVPPPGAKKNDQKFSVVLRVTL